MLTKNIFIQRLILFFIILMPFNEPFSQNDNTTTFYFYRPNKMFSNAIKFKLYLNDVEVGELRNSSAIKCSFSSEGKIEIKLLGYSVNSRSPYLDIQRNIYNNKGETRYFRLVQDEIWILRDENNLQAGKEGFNKTKHKDTFIEDESNPIIQKVINDLVVKNNDKNPVHRALDDKTPPTIEMLVPAQTGKTLQSPNKNLSIVGVIKDNDELFTALVNGEILQLNENGSFKKELALKTGSNLIKIIAIDKSNNKSQKEFEVVYGETRAGKEPEKEYFIPEIKSTGNYYALLIAVNNYDDENIIDLNNPISDGERLYKILTTRYTFEPGNVIFLKDPQRVDIINALDKLVGEVTIIDNLLIFYAGHGFWDPKRETGYWLPSDSRKSSTANWLRNTTLQEYIGDIKSKHTLLIADACFSGGIFKTRKAFNDASGAVNKLYELPSRKAITSGMLNEVPDKSVFMQYLFKRLEQNEEKYATSLDVFTSFRTAVINNSNNTPQYGTIQNSGDEGGDFIFIKKD